MVGYCLAEQGESLMELVNGVSLREMTERCGPLGPEAALAILKDALFELAAAHRRGVVHRDCAPENVFIDTAGNSKLTDFGAAISWDGQTPDGTPLYLAPEQWQGAPESPAADLYAAAVVCFECLAGGPPFSGDVSRLMEQHLAEPMPLRAVDARLRGLIDWGAAKHPADRPHSAIEFASELELVATAGFGPDWERRGRWQLAELAGALLRDRYATTVLAEPPGGAGGGSKRRLAVIAGVAAVAVAALGATAAAVTLTGNSTPQAGTAPRPQLQTEQAQAQATGTTPAYPTAGAQTATGQTASPASTLPTPSAATTSAAPGRTVSPAGGRPSASSRPSGSQHPSRPGGPTASSASSPAPTASSAPPAPSDSATASAPDQSLSVAGCASQATFQQGQSFSCPFTASGGLAPYNWTVTGLPTGLDTTDTGTTLTIVTEQGTGVNWGTYPITVTVQDSEPGFPPVTASQNLNLVVTPAS
jgi:serine/threonine-protein kinase